MKPNELINETDIAARIQMNKEDEEPTTAAENIKAKLLSANPDDDNYNIVFTPSSSSKTVQDEMSLIKTYSISTIPKDELTLVYHCNSSSSPPSATDDSQEDSGGDLDWDDSSSWKFIFRYNSSQTDINIHSDLPHPNSESELLQDTQPSGHSNPTIQLQIHNQDERGVENRDFEQRQYPFPSKLLLVVHPFLKLDSGDTAVNCYLPKKSGKLACVTVKRDPKEPVSVSVHLNSELSITDLLQELSDQGMSSGSNLHKLKSSDLANGLSPFGLLHSSTSQQNLNYFNRSSYNNHHQPLTQNYSPGSLVRPPCSNVPLKQQQQEIKILKVEPAIFPPTTVIIQQQTSNNSSQLGPSGIITFSGNTNTSTVLKSNSVLKQPQLPPRKVLPASSSLVTMGNSKSKSNRPEPSTTGKSPQATILSKEKQVNVEISKDGQKKLTPQIANQRISSDLSSKANNNNNTSFRCAEKIGKQGYMVTCLECKKNSKNLQSCDFCRKIIPRDAKRIIDPAFQATSESSIHLTTESKQANFVNYKIPKVNKRSKVQKIVEIDLLSDEESNDGSPGKRQKLEESQTGNLQSSQPAPTSPPPFKKALSSQEQSGSLNSSMDISTSVKSIDDLPVCSLQADNIVKTPDISSDQKTADLNQIREQINTIVKTPSDDHITLSCNVIRVGSYVCNLDDDNWKEEYFKVHFTKIGILFNVNNCVSRGMVSTLVVPHAAILAMSIFFHVRQASFILVRTGNKVANLIRQKLSMKSPEKIWFDPSNGKAPERNIVFVMEKLEESQLEILKKMYSSTITFFDHDTALTFRKDIELKLEGDESDLEFSRVSSCLLTTSKTVPTTIVSTPGVKPCTPRTQPIVIKTTVNNGQIPGPTIKAVTSAVLQPSPYIGENKQIFTWPKGLSGITLNQGDIHSLKAEQFLNDQIIDFWLTYVFHKVLSKEDRERTHIFSTYFYTRLTQKPSRKHCSSFELDKNLTAAEKRHRRVQKWTKKVDIFSKDFVIIPVNDNCHWYLAIICHPGLLGPRWANDNTPVENWKNVTVQNKRPVYQPPPGMPKKEWLKSKRSKPKDANESSGSSSTKLVLSPSSSSTDLSGNPTSSIVSTGETENDPSTQSSDTESKDKKHILPISSTPICNPLEPERDEEDEDPDENTLFEEYYSSDSDEGATEEGQRLDPNGDDTSSAQAVSSTSTTTDTITNTTLQVSEQVADEILNSYTENEAMKSNSSCDIESKVDPMEIDKETKIENPDGVRNDYRVVQPCIIIFDSLSGMSRSRTFNTLREYLRLEYKVRKGGNEERSFSKFDMPGFMPNVPQQKNLYDCGLYVLQYAEYFFSNPLPTFCLPITDLKKWFPLLKMKRKEIYDTIYTLVETENKDNLSLIPKFDAAMLTSSTTSIQEIMMAATQAQQQVASGAGMTQSSVSMTSTGIKLKTSTITTTEKINVIVQQVETAPRQVVTSVQPSEEPMDVDVEKSVEKSN